MASSFSVQANLAQRKTVPLLERVVTCAMHESVNRIEDPFPGFVSWPVLLLPRASKYYLGALSESRRDKHRSLSERVSEHLLAETLTHEICMLVCYLE